MAKTASSTIWLILITILPTMFFLVLTNKTMLMEWNLLSLTSTPILFSVILDPKGIMFCCTVLFISANVLQFSTLYMSEDKFIGRFTVLVLLFILSMNMLILFPHFMVLLLGWDGLGIVSFILVIYYQNSKSLAAGMITVLTNRIGDVMILLAIAWTLNQGHWNILHMWTSPYMNFQVICIMVAAMTKSAQMPFSSWLPAAMAAPTPVSALVHSSTLVTAGVFLLIRFYPFLEKLPMFNSIILFTAVSTMVMAGISASTECDMKKIIALSTLSQLGMMMTSLGLGAPSLAYFHMLTHALFKALLFICAGTLINFHMHAQDLRWMGNLTTQMPVTASCMLISNMALCGLPFLAGFYSKDLIIESSMFYSHNMLMMILIIMSVGLTSFYSMRFMTVTVWSQKLSTPMISFTEPMSSSAPMIILSSMAITSGSVISWIIPIINHTLISTLMKLTPMIMVFTGVFLGLFSKSLSSSFSKLIFWNKSHFASCSMWFLVPISTQFMLKSPMLLSHQFLKSMDQSWLELMEGQGMSKSINKMSNFMYLIQPKSPMMYISTSFILIFIISISIH